MRLHDERSTLTRAPPRGPRRPRRRPRRRSGLEQAVAGDVEPVAALEPGRVELVGAQLGRDAAVGGHRPRSVRLDERHDDAAAPVGVRADAARPRAARGRRPRAAPARRCRACRRTGRGRRARPPRPRRSPPARRRASRVVATASSPARAAEPSRTITSRSRSPRVVTSTPDRRSVDSAPCRRTRSSRRPQPHALASCSAASSAPPRCSPPPAAGGRAPSARRPAGLAAFEGAPCFRETLERERGTSRSSRPRAAPARARSCAGSGRRR